MFCFSETHFTVFKNGTVRIQVLDFAQTV